MNNQVGSMVLSLLLTQDVEAPAAAPVAQATTLLEYLKNSGIVGFSLLILSVFAVALVILHLLQVRKARMAPPDVVAGLMRMLREGDLENAVRFCKAPENDSFLARAFGHAILRCARSSLGMLEFRAAVEEAGQRETDRLFRQTDLLGLIAALGPMLGLLGTVFGMIGAFGSISALEGASRSRELAGFMAMALVNTAQGLAVAIPCTAAFSLFRRRIDQIASEVAEISESLVAAAGAPSKPQQGTRPAGARPLPSPVVPAPAPRPVDLPRT